MMNRSQCVVGSLVLVLLGFALGRWSQPSVVHGQVRPILKKPPAASAGQTPGTRYHRLRSLQKLESRRDLNLLLADLPDSPKPKHIGELQDLPFVKNAVQFDPPKNVVFQFADIEAWYLAWLDRIEIDAQELLSRRHEEAVRYIDADQHPKDVERWSSAHPAFALLPPPDGANQGDRLQWLVQRHPNGRVRSITPCLGNVLRGEGRIHGCQLLYNDKGHLVEMNAYLNGRRHGPSHTFDGTDRSRRQTPKASTRWANGRRVLNRQAPRRNRPPAKPE